MLAKPMEKALNQRVNVELESAYLYLAMAAYFEEANLSGFGHWMKTQAKEELMHGMKIYDYILERGGSVTLGKVEAPTKTWKSPLAAMQATYEHEKMVTKGINDVVTLARGANDYATEIFFQWFVTEQVEEEDTALKIVDRLKLLQEAPGGLYMMDRELGSRA